MCAFFRHLNLRIKLCQQLIFYAGTHSFIKDESMSFFPIDFFMDNSPIPRELVIQLLLGKVFRYSVYPDTTGRHGLAKSQFDPVGPQMLPIHLPHGSHHRANVRILAESKC